ncbi:hypothetical protein SETIT_9G510400v2 [Setaria italica]|uniref:Uncharacterized protein n=1 Tax=Setaria italica TaxID=4555 RepID=K4A6Z8_SETIT|nr:uncharacterized protein LOC101781606 [Setaria italica]RCV46160.1 hypothetical protein SETIT_9G510400v2 [Setaria italica]
MGRVSCFTGLLGGRRKASKGKNKGAYARRVNGNDCPKVKPVEFLDMADTVDVSRRGDNVPACNSKFVVGSATGLARRGSGENGDKAAIKRGCSSGADLVVVAGAGSSGYDSNGTGKSAKSIEPDAGESSSVGRMFPTPTASPKLKRSCSNIETTTRSSAPPKGFEFDLPAKSRSDNDLNAVPPARSTTPSGAPDASPAASVRTSCSADRVMLKKRSSRQVLPSRSRRLWWQLFLWSHRNLHRAGAAMPALPSAAEAPHQHDGYTSDTLDAITVATADAKDKDAAAVEEDPIPSQWVAFSAEASSPLDRVSAWVNSLGDGSFHAVDEEEDAMEHDVAAVARPQPQCSEIVELPAAGKRHNPQARRRAADEAANQASSIVHTLNVFSSVAHISGMGLKAVPAIAAFSTLRAVNLSGNLIVQVAPGSLPKGLHSLDLSRNKIATIEGLRELTKLRVLNLSYNRISRIGHGLSGCTAIRELYLAGNKISDVEGLHRLLKLAVLDVGFNRITTAKSLGQLVANYASLRALNLLGNPVQAATGDDTLRRAVSGLLPRIEYLNRQAVKPQRAREVAKDSVAQAALGNGGGWSSRRRTARRVTQSPGPSSRSRGRDGGSSRRASRSRSKTRRNQGTSLSISRR